MSQFPFPDELWTLLQAHLGYSDEEMTSFKSDPRNLRVLARAMELQGKTIVFEVVESHGCRSRHAVGTRFLFSADGNLLTKRAPSKVCAFLLPVMAQAVFGIQELIYAGVDPNTMCFKRGGCFDVGTQCGGWGRVVVEASVVDRQ
jgi:hypothetical protein